MDQFIPLLGYWVWWAAAGVLLMLELLAPGVFFIWLAIAAVVTGLADMMFGLSWQAEAILFALAACVSVYAGRMILKRRGDGGSDRPHLNQRLQGYVGNSYVLREAITGGKGKLTIDDTVWEVTGPDQPAGARVKVTATDGMRLTVTSA